MADFIGDTIMGPTWVSDPDVVISYYFESMLSVLSSVIRRMSENEKIATTDSYVVRIRHETERLYLWGHAHSIMRESLDESFSSSVDIWLAVHLRLYELGAVVRKYFFNYADDDGLTKNLPLEHDLEVGMEAIQTILEENFQENIDYIIFPEPDDDEIDLSDPLEEMKVIIDCLMELSLAMGDWQTESATPLSISLCCRRIQKKFPLVSPWLAERFGKAYSTRSENFRQALKNSQQNDRLTWTDFNEHKQQLHLLDEGSDHVRITATPSTSSSTPETYTSPPITQSHRGQVIEIPDLPRATGRLNDMFICPVCSQYTGNTTNSVAWR